MQTDIYRFMGQSGGLFWMQVVGCAELQGSVSLKKKSHIVNICEHKLLIENVFP